MGEKDHYAADREVADRMLAILPDLAMMVRAHQRFVYQAVWHAIARLGIRQFVELGSGVPAMCSMNLHEIAQDVDPTAHVLYVDDDPIVAAHSRALLTSQPAGRVEFLHADIADPGALLNHDLVTSTLDLTQPVALMAVSVLAHFPDALAHHVVSTLLAGLPAGSCLVLGHLTADFNPDGVAAAVAVAREAGITYIPRTHAQVMRFFTGLDPIGPGVVPLLAWTPDTRNGAVSNDRFRDPTGVNYWVGVGRRRSLVPPGAT
jgi:hypothetical protein